MRRRNKERLTLKDVAVKLGVSTATISNAFNRPTQLSKKLREDILQACKDIGYSGPGAESRQLRTEKTRVIGVMLSNQLSYSFSDPVANQMLQGLSQIFEQPEFNLLVMPSRRELKHLSGIESFVEGFIIYGPPAQGRLDELLYHRKAIIAIDFELEGITSINIDNKSAARDIALHAFKHKPLNPAIIGLRIAEIDMLCTMEQTSLLPIETNISVQRLQGYMDAAITSEVFIPNERIWSVPDNNHAYAYQAARQALSCQPRPDLLICMSDRIAISALKAAQDIGIKVPEELKITGFDGIEEARQCNPSITTIAQPSMDKGRIAAEIFLGQREEASVVLNAPLRQGKSCPDIY